MLFIIIYLWRTAEQEREKNEERENFQMKIVQISILLSLFRTLYCTTLLNGRTQMDVAIDTAQLFYSKIAQKKHSAKWGCERWQSQATAVCARLAVTIPIHNR